MADSPVAAYIVKQSNGQFKVTGKSYSNAPYGIAIPKGNGHGQADPRRVERAHVQRHVHDDPQKYGVQTGAIKNPTINGATS